MLTSYLAHVIKVGILRSSQKPFGFWRNTVCCLPHIKPCPNFRALDSKSELYFKETEKLALFLIYPTTSINRNVTQYLNLLIQN